MKTAAALLAALTLVVGSAAQHTERTMEISKLTPILYVEEIEPTLPFWLDRLGFQVVSETPEGNRLGFVILQRGDIQIMMQTRASMEADIPAMADTPLRGTILFLQVDSLDPVLEAIEGSAEVVMPRRQTSYGADEIYVREPGGNLVGFAAF